MKFPKPEAVLARLAQAVFPFPTPKRKVFVFSAACEAVFNQCKCSLEEEHPRKLWEQRERE